MRGLRKRGLAILPTESAPTDPFSIFAEAGPLRPLGVGAMILAMSDGWMVRWEAAEAEWVSARSIGVALPELAVDALHAGRDSPSLRVLAGMSPREDARDLRDMFLAAVRELGRELPGTNDAAARLLRLYSLAITQHEVSPYDGARLIARLGYDFSHELHDQVMSFVALEAEYSEEWGRSRDEVEAAIVREARALADPN